MKGIKVVAAVMIRAGEVFATQRGYGAWKGYWEFPGGKIEPGEQPEEALVREIREELDVEINIQEHLFDVEYDYPDFHLSMQCFLCALDHGTPKLLEHEAARWLSRETLLSVNWLPADQQILPEIAHCLERRDLPL